MTLAELLLPQDHLRMIKRYNRILEAKKHGEMRTALSCETIAHKLTWHVEQYALKTGNLPDDQ